MNRRWPAKPKRDERLPPTKESDFQWLVREAARKMGWTLEYCTWDSRCSPGGFPDLVLARPRGDKRVLFIELKSEKGKLTPQQAAWIEGLRVCGKEVYVWRPSDFDTIVATLQRP